MTSPFIEGINYFVNNVSITVILLLKIKTDTIVLTKVFRRKKVLAHALACQAVVSVDTDVWLEDLSHDLDDVLLFDLA